MPIINSVEECYDKIDVSEKYPDIKRILESVRVSKNQRIYAFKCKICGYIHDPWKNKDVNFGIQSLIDCLYQHILLAHIYKVEIPDNDAISNFIKRKINSEM